MGTIEGKLRESYTVKQKPIIRSPCQRGIEPVSLSAYRFSTGLVVTKIYTKA
jgi:hypothetical protein